MSVSYTYSNSERAPGGLFKNNSQPGETVFRRYMPYLVGGCMFRPDLEMRMVRPVDWAIIVRSLVGWGLLVGVVGPKPMVSTMPHFFLLGRVIVPGWKKKTRLTSLVWGTTDNQCWYVSK